MFKMILALLIAVAPLAANATSWERGEPVPDGGRPNPFDWPEPEWPQAIRRGKIHTLIYPVEITGALLPFDPVVRFLEEPSPNPLKDLMRRLSDAFSHIHSFADAMNSLGLHKYPEDAGKPGSSIPLPPGMHVGEAMGLTRIHSGNAVGFTFSCALCHVGQLFGREVIGLTNRFPRANALFVQGKQLTGMVPSPVFAWATEATAEERRLYRRTRHNMFFVGSKRPQALGLDTSLAQVALSLARRARDEDATKDWSKANAPDEEPLAWEPADSKPAVWWNLKYKNRWLSDGSVVSGNPIITNILWNEIGRGTDLVELRSWIAANLDRVKDLATAVFATEAPRITEFFPVEKINLEKAKRGEGIFIQTCSRCHGKYEKSWDHGIATTKVIYPKQTFVVDVGTDRHRRDGMESLLALNTLSISKDYGVLIEVQRGYVPPPLVGIWARWPYFHNNSIPSLCALLTRASERPEVYWAGEPLNPATDFDFECNGYPQGDAVPDTWKFDKRKLFNSRKKGLGNSGHDEGIFLSKGVELLSPAQKLDLITYLQTL